MRWKPLTWLSSAGLDKWGGWHLGKEIKQKDACSCWIYCFQSFQFPPHSTSPVGFPGIGGKESVKTLEGWHLRQGQNLQDMDTMAQSEYIIIHPSQSRSMQHSTPC